MKKACTEICDETLYILKMVWCASLLKHVTQY